MDSSRWRELSLATQANPTITIQFATTLSNSWPLPLNVWSPDFRKKTTPTNMDFPGLRYILKNENIVYWHSAEDFSLLLT